MLLILAHSIELVKNFFQSFLKLFDRIADVQQLFKDITLSEVCQALFDQNFSFHCAALYFRSVTTCL